MALTLDSLTKLEVRNLVQQGTDSINSCKNQLTSILSQVDSITSADLTEMGFNTGSKAELIALKTKFEAIKTEIENQGF